MFKTVVDNKRQEVRPGPHHAKDDRILGPDNI